MVLVMRTVEQQTGWKRPHPKMICQEKDILIGITEYNFDLSDDGFLRYATSRGVAYVAGEEGTYRRQFTGDFTKGREVLAEKIANKRMDEGRERIMECVVVEHDWPEYEPTWAAIEARVRV